MSIDTRFTPAIRSALLERMQDPSSRHTPQDTTGPGEPANRPTDRVSLSEDALRIHAVVSMTAGQDIFDVERVTEIRQALATGSYRLDPLRVAEKFHRFNLNL